MLGPRSPSLPAVNVIPGQHTWGKKAQIAEAAQDVRTLETVTERGALLSFARQPRGERSRPPISKIWMANAIETQPRPRAHARAGLGIGRAVAGTIIASRQIRAIIVTATSARVYSRASPRRRLERERTRLRVLTVVVAVSRASTCAAPTLFGIDARRLEGKRCFHRS